MQPAGELLKYGLLKCELLKYELLQEMTMQVDQRNAGMTLVELLVAVSIVVLVTMLAVPNFTFLMHQIQITVTTHQLLNAIVLARSEAIRGQCVVELRAINGAWNNGWIMLKGQSAPLQTHHALTATLHVTSQLSDGMPHIAFDSTGRSRSGIDNPAPQFGRIVISDGSAARAIIINFLGKARTCRAGPDGRCLVDARR